MLFLAMIAMGALIGFVGAGGAGVTIALLTIGFNIPIHTALGVALAAMLFTTISGAYSHYREGEVVVKTGFYMGLGGIIGSFAGANVSNLLPSGIVWYLTSTTMFLSAIILYVKIYHNDWIGKTLGIPDRELTGPKRARYGILVGILMGFIAGSCGIGSAAFIQISLLVIFGISLIQAVGTTMMVIVPISAAGGLGYLLNGNLDLFIFLQTLIGQGIGAYAGAKLTHMAPKPFLKFCIVAMPTIGALMMFIKS